MQDKAERFAKLIKHLRLGEQSQSRRPASLDDESELGLDQPPALSAEGDLGLEAEEIAPAMQDQLRNKLQQAEEMTPEELRAARLRKLFNLKG